MESQMAWELKYNPPVHTTQLSKTAAAAGINISKSHWSWPVDEEIMHIAVICF